MTIDPPSWAEGFRSDDPDEIRERLSRFGTHRRERRGRGSLGFHIRAVRVGGSALGWGGAALGQIVHAETSTSLLHLPLDARITYRSGRRTVEASPRTAVFLPPGTSYTLVSQGGSWLAAQVDDGRLLDELCRREPDCVPTESGLAEVSLDEPRLNDFLRLFRDSATSGPPTGAVEADIEARLVSWTVEELAPLTPAVSADSRRRQRLVEGWIDANLGETITLGRLCAVAGVGGRSLQKSFLRYRGQTPMDWVASRRLASARLQLCEAEESDSVTAIALRCGLSHLGRFSVTYRRTYGESPSASLSRQRPVTGIE